MQLQALATEHVLRLSNAAGSQSFVVAAVVRNVRTHWSSE